MNYIKDYFLALVDLTNEMSPYLLLGFIIAGILHVFFPDDKINRLLGANNFKSVFRAALIGIPLPLCSCGVIPTGISFHRQGASKGSTVSFLISTPQTGVDSIMVTYSLIGLPFAIIRVIVALFTGLAGGLITNLTMKNDKPGEKINLSHEDHKSGKKTNPILEIFKYAFVDFIKDIAKWLVLGLLIAALITVMVPEDFFSTYIDNNLLSMLIILVASIPLYVCATGSVPIAAALIMKGISPGAALVFLMAGPATNAATITVIGKVMGRRTLYSYLGSIIGGALLFGILIDSFIDPELLTGFMLHDMQGHQHEILPLWFKWASSIILVCFLLWAIIQPYMRKLFAVKKNDFDFQTLKLDGSMKNIKVSVKGMNCNHCKMTVENGLKQLDGLKDITANLENESVILSGENIDLEKVKQTVESLGYKYGGEVS